MASQAVLWQPEQLSVCAAAALKETDRARTVDRQPGSGGPGQPPSGQAGIILDLKMPVVNK